MSKKQLLSDIVLADGLGIESVFGEVAWERFLELQQDDEIVVVGNGPVCSFHGEYIENAKMVIRCNHYSENGNTSSEEGRRKIGRKCDVQFICLHGREFKRSGLEFLYEWCRDSKVVLALENSKARKPITEAIKKQQLTGDAIMSKICLPEEDLLPRIFKIDCTRGFYAIAFALQAKKRLELKKPVRCVGFGRKGHEGSPGWHIGHGHNQELLLWIDMWKNGTELVHLEWADFAEEIMATVYPKTFLDKSVRTTSPDMSAAAIQATLETGLKNVQTIIKMASKSKWYKSIPVERLQEMATHGLIIHPTELDYLTCDHHARKGKHICWPGAEALEAHFDARHQKIYDGWRCQKAGERMATIEEICPSIDAPLSGVWADPGLLPRDPMAMPRDPMAMPSPTVAASSSQASSSWHRFGPWLCGSCGERQLLVPFSLWHGRFCQWCGAPGVAMDVDAVGAGEEPKSVDAASDEVPLAAAAEADSSVPPAAAGAPEAMDVDAVGAGEEPQSVDAASDEVPLGAAAEADSSVPPAAAGAPEAMDMDAARAVEEPKSVDATSEEVPLAAAADADNSVPPDEEETTHVDSSLWQWMINYAQFQCAAQTLKEALPGYQHVIEKCSQLCHRTLNAMVSAAPLSDLQYCQTAKGATWQYVVDCFFLYFETRDAAKLNLGDSPITYSALMGAMAQLVKQVLTWHLTNGNAHDCVQAMVCFNLEGSALGAKAICYLSHDSSGTADGVVFALNGCDPTMKYTGRSKPSKTQLAADELASQKRRSDEMGFQVKRTKKRPGPL